MKKSKRCPICNFSDDILEEVHTQYSRLRSSLKVFAWFRASYPQTTVSNNSFDNHFGKGEHFTKEDADKLIVDNEISSEIIVTEPVTIIPLILTKNVPEINPLAHITSLHIKTLEILNSIDKEGDEEIIDKKGNVKKKRKDYATFLRFIQEARKQIELISLLSKKFTPKITNDEIREKINKVEIKPIDEKNFLDNLAEELGV